MATAAAWPAALVATVMVCSAAGKRRGITANREGDRGAGHRKVVPIANLDNRCDGRLLLNDVDRIFALEHHDAKSGRRLAGRRSDREVRAEAQ